ncbi:polysaccharide deacetylase family protein, partial [Streptomyces massasporeus]
RQGPPGGEGPCDTGGYGAPPPGGGVGPPAGGGDRSQSVRALRRYLPELLDSGYHVTVPRRHYA